MYCEKVVGESRRERENAIDERSGVGFGCEVFEVAFSGTAGRCVRWAERLLRASGAQSAASARRRGVGTPASTGSTACKKIVRYDGGAASRRPTHLTDVIPSFHDDSSGHRTPRVRARTTRTSAERGGRRVGGAEGQGRVNESLRSATHADRFIDGSAAGTQLRRSRRLGARKPSLLPIDLDGAGVPRRRCKEGRRSCAAAMGPVRLIRLQRPESSGLGEVGRKRKGGWKGRRRIAGGTLATRSEHQREEHERE